MKKVRKVLGCISLVLLISSCGVKTFDSADQMVDKALETVKLVNAQELKGIMEGEEYFTLIDVRQKSEHYYGYIPGAMVIPRGSLEFNIGDAKFWDDEGLYLPEKDEKIILYCKKGNRSILAAEALLNMGYPNVVALKDGWKGWELAFPDLTEKNLEMLSGGGHEEVDTGGC